MSSDISQMISAEKLSTLSPDLQEIFRALFSLIREKDAEIERLNARIAELESGPNKTTPQNSSVPPATEHPHAKSPPPREKSGRKRGGQPRHPKHQRMLIPSEECDEVIPLRPTECRRCGSELKGSDREPLRHQVWEVPAP